MATCPKCREPIEPGDNVIVQAQSKGAENVTIDTIFHFHCFVDAINDDVFMKIGFFCSYCEHPLRAGQNAVIVLSFVLTDQLRFPNSRGNAYHAECYAKLCPPPPNLLDELGDCHEKERPPDDTPPDSAK